MDGDFKKMAPQAAILISTLLWGTLWIPLREINESRVGGATATSLSFLLGMAVLLPYAAVKARRILEGGWPLAASGFFLAICIALYAEGMVRGEVARVLLLFYLTPVWSTLLARLMLKQPITRRRVMTITLGLIGMAVILGDGMSFPVPRGAADWMGLLSGVAWGLAMVYFQRTAARRDFDRVFAALVFLAPIYFLVTLLPGSRDSVGVDGALMADWVMILVTLALIWLVPVICLTVYGASRMDPGMVAIFLMFEVIIGLASAAWLLDEPFGAREIIGAAFIIAAMLAELSGQDSATVSRK